MSWLLVLSNHCFMFHKSYWEHYKMTHPYSHMFKLPWLDLILWEISLVQVSMGKDFHFGFQRAYKIVTHPLSWRFLSYTDQDNQLKLEYHLVDHTVFLHSLFLLNTYETDGWQFKLHYSQRTIMSLKYYWSYSEKKLPPSWCHWRTDDESERSRKNNNNTAPCWFEKQKNMEGSWGSKKVKPTVYQLNLRKYLP